MLKLKIKKLIYIFSNSLFFNAFLKGTAVGIEHLKVIRNLDLDHIIDIGANKGQFALLCRNLFPNARIDSFEPLKKSADIFSSVFDNDSKTNLYRCAIGNKEQSMDLHISNKDDSSSLLSIGKAQSQHFSGTHEVGIEKVKVKKLENVIDKNNIGEKTLLKIDVQGFELEVLQGCEAIFTNFDYIYCECSFIELYSGQKLADDIINFLAQKEFILKGVYNTYYDRNGIAIQSDLLFQKVNDV